MQIASTQPPTAPLVRRVLDWRRVLVTVVAAALVATLMASGWQSSIPSLYSRVTLLGLIAMFAFTVLEAWPRRLPKWLARWALQVLGVAAAIPLGALAIYVATTAPDQPPFWKESARLIGFGFMTFMGLLLAPWIAISAIFRQREAHARSQSLAFELEKSELERKALDARLRLLQAQVEPHFLFNTLANVRQLVDAGSPQASAVLGSLIAYLRAAVPRLHDPATTVADEFQLARAYLEVMHLRMPDRLKFTLRADDAVKSLACPPMSLLTLVENAIRHGIDPSEEGGTIDVRAEACGGRCCLSVTDTGVGLKPAGDNLGTGLATLRERLHLAYGAEAQLRITGIEPHGVHAEIEFPVAGAK